MATIVVLGTDATRVEAAVGWRDERRIVNPDPARGLSSSLHLVMAPRRLAEHEGDYDFLPGLLYLLRAFYGLKATPTAA